MRGGEKVGNSNYGTVGGADRIRFYSRKGKTGWYHYRGEGGGRLEGPASGAAVVHSVGGKEKAEPLGGYTRKEGNDLVPASCEFRNVRGGAPSMGPGYGFRYVRITTRKIMFISRGKEEERDALGEGDGSLFRQKA